MQEASRRKVQVKEYTDAVMACWGELPKPDRVPGKTWVPKNPELHFDVRSEEEITSKVWKEANFPFHAIPDKITTHVKVKVWEEKMQSFPKTSRNYELLQEVAEELRHGMDSGVVYPGTKVTRTGNFFPTPHIDIPRMADALCTEVKKGHMAGPFEEGTIPNAKINGLVAVEKPDGSRRQVGNLSKPKGSSFNDGIPEHTMKEWPVDQTTSKQFAEMISRAGRRAVLFCCDLVSAYKCLPVCKEQQRLQVFAFGGKLFVDLRAVFGDRKACMKFDRFHRCIMDQMVIPASPIPRKWVGETVDDISGVAPANASHILESFVKEYRKQLDDLGVAAAPADPDRIKAFDRATSGEVLGIWFDTEQMTWQLPFRKITLLVRELVEAAEADSRLTLNQVEIIHGKLNNFASHAPPIKVLVGEVLGFMRDLIQEHKDLDRASMSKSKRTFQVPDQMRHDLRTSACIVWDTQTRPLPILEPGVRPALDAVEVYSDASGQILANPAVGIYVPSQRNERAMVASLALPRYFLMQIDQDGHQAFCKSMTLEALGVLGTLCCDPKRFIGKDVVFHIDNQATVQALDKGYSRKDPWATTVVRASRVVAASLGASLYATWTPRRSSRETRIADNLTHNLLSELSLEEIQDYVKGGMVSFPEPIRKWMAAPKPDQGLGRRCIKWCGLD